MILAGVAIVAALGLGAWALLLNDDLNDTEAELEAQTAAAESASGRGRASHRGRPCEHRRGALRRRRHRGRQRRGRSEAEQAVAEAEQSVAEAQAAVDQAQSELEQARAERDLARAEAEQARAEAAQAELCADASLAATQALAEYDTPPRRTRRPQLAPKRPRALAPDLNEPESNVGGTVIALGALKRG